MSRKISIWLLGAVMAVVGVTRMSTLAKMALSWSTAKRLTCVWCVSEDK